MNKKAVGQVGAVILFLMFLIMWFVFLGAWLNQVGQGVIDSQSLTGIEAFAFANLNLIVLICCTLGIMGWVYFTAGD